MTNTVFADAGGWSHMWGSGTGMGWGWVWMALFVVGTVWFIFGLVKRDDREPGPKQRNAREVLDQRYANGDIDSEDYKRRKADLEL